MLVIHRCCHRKLWHIDIDILRIEPLQKCSCSILAGHINMMSHIQCIVLPAKVALCFCFRASEEIEQAEVKKQTWPFVQWKHL